MTTAAPPRAASAVESRRPLPRTRWPLPQLLVLAILAGLASGTGFAPLGWWPLTVLGVAGLALTVRRATGFRAAAAVGLAYGLGLTALTLNWMRVIDVGAAVGLVVVVALWYAILGLLLRLAGRTGWWPLLGAASWVGIDFASSRFPFGGFGWLRLGYPVIDSPLTGLLPLVGVAGAGFAVALLGLLLAWLLEDPGGRRAGRSVAFTAVVAAASLAGNAIPPAAATGEAVLGWVQGGAPGGGVYGLGGPRTITKNQTAATAKLAAAIEAGEHPVPDFVVWPENSTDLDPTADPETGALVARALESIGRPILLGTILQGPRPDERRTVAQWAEADGTVGPSYVKRGIVPFGEWIPFRDVLLPLVPKLGYVGAQSLRGTEPGLLDVRLADGSPAALGVLVCYDVIFDPVVHDVAAADLLVVQSSNAMYQGTGQIEQQFAITRARAAELRREILVVTTSGVSGLIGADGEVVWRDTGPGSAFGVDALPLRTGETPASRLAGPLELLLTLSALGWLGLLAARGLRRPRTP